MYVIAGRRANVRADITIRPGTADQSVFSEVFLAREYEIDDIDPKTIIDAGAHIGLTSVMLANRFPSATVIAIEPEPSNFALLVRNARSYANIKPIHAGLWGHATTLSIENPEAATWSYRVREGAQDGRGIRAVSIPQIMDELGLKHIELMKIDIEGAEIEVLRNAEVWIAHIDVLMIELHDRYRPGCTAALEQALSEYAYRRSVRGNTIIIRDIRSRLPSAFGQVRRHPQESDGVLEGLPRSVLGALTVKP